MARRFDILLVSLIVLSGIDCQFIRLSGTTSDEFALLISPTSNTQLSGGGAAGLANGNIQFWLDLEPSLTSAHQVYGTVSPSGEVFATYQVNAGFEESLTSNYPVPGTSSQSIVVGGTFFALLDTASREYKWSKSNRNEYVTNPLPLFSSDGKSIIIVSGNSDGWGVQEYDLSSGKTQRTISFQNPKSSSYSGNVSDVSLDNENNVYVIGMAGGDYGYMKINLEEGKVEFTRVVNFTGVSDLVISAAQIHQLSAKEQVVVGLYNKNKLFAIVVNSLGKITASKSLTLHTNATTILSTFDSTTGQVNFMVESDIYVYAVSSTEINFVSAISLNVASLTCQIKRVSAETGTSFTLLGYGCESSSKSAQALLLRVNPDSVSNPSILKTSDNSIIKVTSLSGPIESDLTVTFTSDNIFSYSAGNTSPFTDTVNLGAKPNTLAEVSDNVLKRNVPSAPKTTPKAKGGINHEFSYTLDPADFDVSTLDDCGLNILKQSQIELDGTNTSVNNFEANGTTVKSLQTPTENSNYQLNLKMNCLNLYDQNFDMDIELSSMFNNAQILVLPSILALLVSLIFGI
eukprot:CAMPEP_0114995228 /NCGR_PEP_ID=MMETSP0216-20121206/13607_1 /TAXON_ID=223996 /ORGANISM="Protocruzia adherens, Strain Boccale" /LENGTH=572 /DNA_ID=CAMNT_0002359235 /DNA_START=160 /DNA_END=1878 /DNA_ORIENTATION=+